jgi:hypothetical protein
MLNYSLKNIKWVLDDEEDINRDEKTIPKL